MRLLYFMYMSLLSMRSDHIHELLFYPVSTNSCSTLYPLIYMSLLSMDRIRLALSGYRVEQEFVDTG